MKVTLKIKQFFFQVALKFPLRGKKDLQGK